jgi:hypothetical protein
MRRKVGNEGMFKNRNLGVTILKTISKRDLGG